MVLHAIIHDGLIIRSQAFQNRYIFRILEEGKGIETILKSFIESSRPGSSMGVKPRLRIRENVLPFDL